MPQTSFLREGEQALVALDLLSQLLNHELELLDEHVATLKLGEEPVSALLQLQYLILRGLQRVQQIIRRVLLHLQILVQLLNLSVCLA